jgi:hypothetical protein
MKIFDYSDLISDDESSFLIAADWLEEQGREYEATCLRRGYGLSILFIFLDVDFTFLSGDGYIYSTYDNFGDGTGAGYGNGVGSCYGDGDGYGYGDSYGGFFGFGFHISEPLLVIFASISQGISKS